MTVPSERLRAIRWGGGLVGALQLDDSVPNDLVARATVLAKIIALEALIDAEAAALLAEFADAIGAASELFAD